jgi:hypothetical protein
VGESYGHPGYQPGLNGGEVDEAPDRGQQ